jgi:hypothetical protein
VDTTELILICLVAVALLSIVTRKISVPYLIWSKSQGESLLSTRTRPGNCRRQLSSTTNLRIDGRGGDVVRDDADACETNAGEYERAAKPTSVCDHADMISIFFSVRL